MIKCIMRLKVLILMYFVNFFCTDDNSKGSVRNSDFVDDNTLADASSDVSVWQCSGQL